MLVKLPRETLQEIAAHLSPSSALALAVACKALWSTLRLRHVHVCDLCTPGEKQQLLALLARDLPRHRPCQYCLRLHPIKRWRGLVGRAAASTSSSTPSLARAQPPVPCVFPGRLLRGHGLPGVFDMAAFRMAARDYHQRPACAEFWRRKGLEEAGVSRAGDYLIQSREEGRVFEGRLVHRLQ